MPGFSEYSKHSSEFNSTISSSELIKREMRDRALIYLNSIGISDTTCCTYSIRGRYLKFYYWRVSGSNRFLVKRVVDLLDGKCSESRGFTSKKVILAYDDSWGCFFYL